MRTLLSFAALAALTATADAQITKPPMSPRAVLEQEVGLGKITIDYGRPSLRGREMIGVVEKYGVVWRTGANACTKITLTDDAEVGGEALKAGTYGLYTIPGEETWTVIFSNQANLWGAGGYDPAQDAARVDVKATRLASPHETLTIDLQGFHANGADLVIAWENVSISVPVKVDTDTRVMQEIDEKVRNAKGEVSARTYFDAAMYLYEKKENLADAEAWMDKAVEMQPQAWWQAYYQAELAFHLGKHAKAKAAAEKALAGAEASERGDFGYGARTKALLEKIHAAMGGK